MNHLNDLLIELYKRNDISQLSLSDKQREAFLLLMDSDTKELVYGGAAGGGKTWLGCTWIIFNCLAFPGTKWFIGRKQLIDLSGSVLISINKVCKYYDFDLPQFNGKHNFFRFENGSQIDFKECRFRPEDRFYERLGSIEYTGGWIEEGGEIPFDAFDTLKSRIGRHLNSDFKLTSKILITCNPKKNWLYKDYFKPHKNNTLKKYQKFIAALITDNPHLDSDYRQNLENLKDKAKKERLLKGNWEYDNDENSLIESYDNILNIFNCNYNSKTKKKYITCDAARFGSDKCIIIVWDGYTLIDYAIFDKSKTTEISNKIIEFQRKYKITNKNTIVDSDGVGGGVVDEVGCVGFVNNGTAIKQANQKQEYDNIKSQCAFLLADKINENQIVSECLFSENEIESIIQELEQLKRMEDDRKLRLIKKDEMKQNIGRSPDWLDTFIMRMWFDLKPVSVWDFE